MRSITMGLPLDRCTARLSWIGGFLPADLSAGTRPGRDFLDPGGAGRGSRLTDHSGGIGSAFSAPPGLATSQYCARPRPSAELADMSASKQHEYRIAPERRVGVRQLTRSAVSRETRSLSVIGHGALLVAASGILVAAHAGRRARTGARSSSRGERDAHGALPKRLHAVSAAGSSYNEVANTGLRLGYPNSSAILASIAGVSIEPSGPSSVTISRLSKPCRLYQGNRTSRHRCA